MTFANVSKILPRQNGHMVGRATVSEETCSLSMRHAGATWRLCQSHTEQPSAIDASRREVRVVEGAPPF
jgi:hypothetical protein